MQRHHWTSQQKAAQALAVALKPASWKGREEEIYRALIPLLTSQRSRVFNAALSCLRKVSGQKMGPDADAWKAWFEKTFTGKKLDLSGSVYEWMAVIKPQGKGYTVGGEAVAGAAALQDKLQKLAGEAKAKNLAFAAVIQIPDQMMNRIAQTNNFGPVQEAMTVVAKVTGGCTVSPESDVFRAVYRAGVPSVPTSQPADPESAWQGVLKALQAGDKNAVAQVTTGDGYESLIRNGMNGPHKDMTPEQMRSLGQAWAKWELRFTKRTADAAAAELGPVSRATPGLSFVKMDDGWKLDKWTPGE